MRSISNVVDVTNYVMHVWGSPLHAFDRAKLAGGRIVVRRAHEGETLRTLDGTERTLLPTDLLITDGEKAVALAAIMGGLDSEVSDETTDVLLEAANFEPIGILGTSERLALRTEGSNKWEKGVDPYAAEPAAVLASRLLVDLAGAEPTGSVDVNDGLPERPVVTLTPGAVARSHRPRRAGRRAAVDPRATRLRRRRGMARDGADLPRARRDAGDRPRRGGRAGRARPRAEHHAAQSAPWRATLGRAAVPARARDVLVGAGYSEAYTWSLVPSDPDPAALRLPDPMSGEHAVLRTTLLHGLLEAARVNVDAGNPDIRLFEMARGLPSVRGAATGRAVDPLGDRGGRFRGGPRRAGGDLRDVPPAARDAAHDAPAPPPG
jgi:phenylalanyl-tRNA synthetase beta chain